MEPTGSFRHLTVESRIGGAGHRSAGDKGRARDGLADGPVELGVCEDWEPVRGACGLRDSQAVRVAACGCSVGARGTERKPLASLGLGLTAALRVRSVRVVAPVAAWSATRPARRGRRRTR
jgi:hypothetical protein